MSIRSRLLVAPDERLDEFGARHFPLERGALQVFASTAHVAVTFPDSLRLLELGTGKKLWRFDCEPDESPYHVELGPDGSVWVETGSRTLRLTELGELAWEVAIAADQYPTRQIFVGMARMTICYGSVFHVYDLSTGAQLESFDTSDDLALSRHESFGAVLPVPDALVAPIGRDLTVWRDGELDALVERSGAARHYGAGMWLVSPAGNRVAELAMEGSDTSVLETERFETVADVRFAATGGRFLDETRLVLWTQDHVVRLDLGTGAVATHAAGWSGHRTFSVVDERVAVSLSGLGELCIWDPSTFPAAELPTEPEFVRQVNDVVAAALGEAGESESVLLRGQPHSRLTRLDHTTGALTEHPHELPVSVEKLARVADDMFAVMDGEWTRPASVFLWNRRDDTVQSGEFDRILSAGPGFVLASRDSTVYRLGVPELEVTHRWVAPANAVIDRGFSPHPQLVQLSGDYGVYDIDTNRRVLEGTCDISGSVAVSRGWDPVTYQQVLSVWDIETGERLGEIEADNIYEFMISAPTRSVLLKGPEGLSIWRPGGTLSNLSPSSEAWIDSNVLSDDGRWVIGWGRALSVWRADATDAPPITLDPGFYAIRQVICQNDRLLVTNPHGLIALYELEQE